MDQISDVIRGLKTSPLFYLFLSSRELFHTNFWFWLSTLNKTETLRLFVREPSCEEGLVFKREHRQGFEKEKAVVDLLISCNGAPYIVIENKVKDFPTAGQLKRIKQSFDDDGIQYLLTTLFFSPEIVFNGWQIKTYRELSINIQPSRFTENKYFESLIEDYKDFTGNLADLVEMLPVSKNYDFANNYNLDLRHT
jgi:hypothetical protein